MTTETAPDPIVHDWANDLEDELAEVGMEPPQAKAYARAFELGMTRVLSIMATKYELKSEIAALRQELKSEIAALRQELRDEIAQLRDDLRREMEIRSRHLMWAMGIGFGIMAGMMSAIIALLV